MNSSNIPPEQTSENNEHPKIYSYSEIKFDEKEYNERLKDKQQYLRAQASQNFNILIMVGDFCNRQPIYYDKAKMWWIWNKDKFRWELTDEIDILNSLRYTFDIAGITKGDIRTQIIEAFKLVSRDRKPKDTPINWIQFGSLIVDIETGEERLATPEYFLTNSLPYKPSDNTDTPNIDRLFGEWVGAEYIPTLFEIMAYCCYRDYPIHRLFCLNGSGLNGKGTFLRLIEKVIGKENTCSVELDELLTNRFSRANLYKKTSCFMGETNFNQLKNTSILKKLTGQDLINFEFKGKNPFDEYNYAKIIISTNSLPITQDKTDGFYRRWLIIDFPNRFSEKSDVLATIPEQEYKNLSRKLIYYLKELIKKRAFTSEGTIEERRQRFEEKSNPISKFLELYCESVPDKHIFKYEFKEKLILFLKDNGYRTLSDIEINSLLRAEGYSEEKKYHTKVDGSQSQIWAWIGISWKDYKVNNPSNPKNPTFSTQFPYIEKQVKNTGFLGFLGLSEERI